MRRTSRCNSAELCAAADTVAAGEATAILSSWVCSCVINWACPSCLTATVSTTGQPSSRDSPATSMARPCARATSAIFSATISGLPRRLSSSTRRRFMRKLVASTTATMASGAASPSLRPSITSSITCSSGVAGVRLYEPGKSTTEKVLPLARRAVPTLRSTVTPA